MRLKDYVNLNEAIEPRQTRYGTNEAMDNGKFQVLDNGTVVTFFEHNNSYFAVVVGKTGKVVFGQSQTHSLDANDYSLDRVSTRNAMTVFNKVFFVVTEIFNKELTSQRFIEFKADNKALESMYEKMVKNDSFRQAIKKLGVRFLEKDGDKYVFARSV